MFEDLRRIPNYTPSVGANGRSPLLDMVVLRKSCVSTSPPGLMGGLGVNS